MGKTPEIQEKNQVVRWGCLLSSVFFLSMTGLIVSVDDEVLHHPKIVSGPNFEIALHVLVTIFSLALLRWVIMYKARSLNRAYLKRFKGLDGLGAFEESLQKINLPGEKPYQHAVLLIHGFTASTQEFDCLVEKLQEAGLPYFAPMVPGFGTDEARVLGSVTHEDWLRRVVESYDLLASVAEEVSVVGHSLGGMLSVALTEYRKPKHLIICGPGLYPADSDKKYKTLMTRPIVSQVYVSLVPYLPKPIRPGRVSPSDTLNAARCKQVFQFLAVPIGSVKQLFHLQNKTDVTKVRCQDFTVIYGTEDLTVGMDDLFEVLDNSDVKYEKHEFKNSAHNVFEDNEREEACDLVVSILQRD